MKPLRLQVIDDDAAQQIRSILSDRALRVSLYGGDGNASEDSAVAKWCTASYGETQRLVTYCEEIGEIVGAVALAEDQLSYFIARQFWSMGYGRAMVQQFLRTHACAPNTAPLTARAARNNMASRRILESVGFREVGLYIPPGGLACVIKYERRPSYPVQPDRTKAIESQVLNNAQLAR